MHDAPAMYEYEAIVTSVYDGDTITADVDLGMKVWFHGAKLRLYGINTPEVRGPEKKDGYISRDRLRELVLGQKVTIKSTGRGKYGRWIVVITHEGRNINQLLVDEGLAKQQDY